MSRMLDVSLSLVLSLTGCVGMGGEIISLTHDVLLRPPGTASGTVFMPRTAEDERKEQHRIGRATFTVFAITSGNIVTRARTAEEVAVQVKESLQVAGYDVQLFDQVKPPTPPVPILTVEIQQFYFKNYNWFWPIVPTWGDIALDLRVERPDGVIAFNRRFSASGNSLCLSGECAFRHAISEAMTEVLNQIVSATAAQNFRAAVALDSSPERSGGLTP